VSLAFLLPTFWRSVQSDFVWFLRRRFQNVNVFIAAVVHIFIFSCGLVLKNLLKLPKCSDELGTFCSL